MARSATGGTNCTALKMVVTATASVQQGFTNGQYVSYRYFLSNNQVHVTCGGDFYDAAGTDIGGFSCTDFRPLVK